MLIVRFIFLFWVTARIGFTSIKGALCSFGEEIQTHNCVIYNISEAMIQTQKIDFSITE